MTQPIDLASVIIRYARLTSLDTPSTHGPRPAASLWSGIASAIRGAFGKRPTLQLSTKRPPLSDPKSRMLTRFALDCSRALDGKPMRFRWRMSGSPIGPSEPCTTARDAP